MENIQAARTSRKVTLTQLTRMAEKIETEGDSWSQIQISIKLKLLENYYYKFEKDQTNIELLAEADNDDFEHRGKFEDIYSFLKEKLLMLKSKFDSSSPTPSVVANGSASRVKSVLPPIQLPRFEGCYSKWPEFINMFTTLINNDQDLSVVEKFQLLKNSLAGTAAAVIQSLECSEENYLKALELLTSRYSNNRLIFGAHINKIMNIGPVVRGSVQQLRDLVDNLNGEIRALQSLGTKEQITEAILINTVTSKLDSMIRSKWKETEMNEFSQCSFRMLRNGSLNSTDYVNKTCSEAITNYYQKT